MTEDTAERILRFMERQEDRLPPRVSNGMLLLALREIRDDVQNIQTVLHGTTPDHANGLAARVQRLEIFRKLVVWLSAAITTALFTGWFG